MADGYRYELVIRHDGDVLVRQEVGAASAVEDALLRAVLRGDIAGDTDLPAAVARPRWDDDGEPHVAGIEVELDDDDRTPVDHYDTEVFGQRARGLIRGLVAEGKLATDDTVAWTVQATRRPPRKSRIVGARVQRRPFPLTEAELADIEPGAIETRIHENVLADIDRQLEATPLVEFAGLLAGRVLYDPARTACGVEIVRYFALPAGDGGSSGAHFDFGPATFGAMRRTIAGLDGGLTCTGWAHSHPACDACKDNPTCPTQTVFFSEDDLAVHASSFAAPYHVGIVAGKLANRPMTDPGFLAFGWRRGVVENVPFRIERGHGEDRTLGGPMTSASLIEPIDAEVLPTELAPPTTPNAAERP